MNRRDFLSLLGASTISVAMPFQVTQEITIVDSLLADDWFDIVTVQRFETEFEILFDVDEIWPYVILIDSDGREWRTEDKQIWKSGLLSFELPIDND